MFSQGCKGRLPVTHLIFGPNRTAFLGLEKLLADEAEHGRPSLVNQPQAYDHFSMFNIGDQLTNNVVKYCEQRAALVFLHQGPIIVLRHV